MLLTFFLTHILDSMPFVPTLLSVREYIFFDLSVFFLQNVCGNQKKVILLQPNIAPLVLSRAKLQSRARGMGV